MQQTESIAKTTMAEAMHPVRYHVYHTDSHGDRVHFSTPQHQFSHGGESVQGSITIGSGGSTGAAAAGAVS